MKKRGKILVIDDSAQVLKTLQLLLAPYFEEVRALASTRTLPTTLRSESWQVVLLDMNLSPGLNNGNEGIYWLGEIKRLAPQVPVVLFTAFADIELAVKGMQLGAYSFVEKPWDNQKLIDTLLQAAEKGKGKGKPRTEQPVRPPMYWGQSPAMKQLKSLVEKVAVTDANVLLTGENGTGKEMLAQEIHARSLRSHLGMVSVDMGALTESLFESELFGHKKGSFTDAMADRTGKFEAAHQSTLFLDEIGNLPLHLQAKLLTAIQRRCVVRIGSNTPIPVDIRLVCATNRNLQAMVADGTFREDLLYRINTIHLEIPPLRERKEDILPLAVRFGEQFARRYGKPFDGLTDEAARRLLSHPWPGNIRELEHAVEKAVIISDGGKLTAELFTLACTAPPAEEAAASTTLEEMEKRMIAEAISRCGGNLSAVASQLGITRQTLYNKIKKYGI